MKVLIQWATSVPGDWTTYDLSSARDVRNLPRKSEPGNSPIIDNSLGWIAAINLQGVIFSGYDHVGFGLVNSVLVVTAWNDDPDDFGPGERWGQVWTFAPPAPDPAIGGRVNTIQTVTWYGEPNSAPAVLGIGPLLPYADLVLPHANLTLHGVWLPDPLWDAHRATQTQRGWRDWLA